MNLEESIRRPALPWGVRGTRSRWTARGCALGSSHRGLRTTQRCGSLKLTLPKRPPDPTRKPNHFRSDLIPSGLGASAASEVRGLLYARPARLGRPFLHPCTGLLIGVLRPRKPPVSGIARRSGVGRRAHLLVDVRGEPVDVPRVECAVDGVPLPANLDRDDVGFRHRLLRRKGKG